MVYEDRSGLPDAFNRGPLRPKTSRMIYRDGEQYFAQGAEMNELDFIIARRNRRVSDRSIKDGDRMEGAEAIVLFAEGSVHCYPGNIYVEGDIHEVGDAMLTGVPMTGRVTIGVRVVRTIITELEDPTLYGIAPGTDAEGEAGAAREEISLTWGFSGDGGTGELYSVYLLQDATILSQIAPPALTGVIDQIARYDYDALGHYAVGEGCMVSALGLFAGNQVFSIAHGVANILGYKRERQTAFTVRRPEDPDLETVTGETAVFTGATGTSTTVTVARGPIKDLTLAIVTKRKVETVLRSTTPGGIDVLQESGAVTIESVVQGATTFPPASYLLSANGVNWGPAGSEPAASTTYTVTYLYNTSVLPTATFTSRTVTVAGGVQTTSIVLGYTSKVPRIDLMCLDISGAPVYVKGISSRRGALPPTTPSSLLKLAEINNDWFGAPLVDNNGPRNVTFETQGRFFSFMKKMAFQFERSKAQYEPRVGTPSSKDGIFTDTFVDDFFRDPNEAQTASVNQGVLQLPISNVLMQVILGTSKFLNFTEEVVVSQPQRTSAQLINPYDNFLQMPAGMKIEPAADFWTEQVVQWTSPVTRNFTAAPDTPPGQEEIIESSEAASQVAAEFLRQRTVDVVLSGFGVGETLQSLVMDGVNVKPAGTFVGNAAGQISLTFTIPAGIPVGRRRIRAQGAAGSFAEAVYVGAGQIDVTTMRRVTLVTRAAPVPIQITQNFTTIEQTIINNTTNVVNTIVNPIVTQPTPVFNPVTQTWPNDNDDNATNDNDGPKFDPLAQSFTVPTDRMIVGFNIWIEDVGLATNGIRLQLATMLNGFPTTDVMAEAFLPMTNVQPGDKVALRFPIPVHLSPTREYCFVILTSDGEHAISVARLGDVVGTGLNQQRVSSQPYTIGEMFSSSNRITWTPHPDTDIAFEVVAARFNEASKTVVLWTGAVTNVSDILIRGAAEVPTQDATIRFEIVRAGGAVIQMEQGQTKEFAEFLNETITLRAVLTGNFAISPILYPGTLLAGGRIATTATYVSKAFTMGTNREIDVVIAAFQPSGSTLAFQVDAADGNFTNLTLDTTLTLGEGWTEPKFRKLTHTAIQGRLKLTMTGGPAQRISVAALRGFSI